MSASNSEIVEVLFAHENNSSCQQHKMQIFIAVFNKMSTNALNFIIQL